MHGYPIDHKSFRGVMNATHRFLVLDLKLNQILKLSFRSIKFLDNTNILSTWYLVCLHFFEITNQLLIVP